MQVGQRDGSARTYMSGETVSKHARGAPTRQITGPYQRRLSLYQLPPTGDISTEDFERGALERLRSALRRDFAFNLAF
jgi:hypothetical protein